MRNPSRLCFSSGSAPAQRVAHLARRLLLHQLDAWGVQHGSEASDTAALLVAELAANAAPHGRYIEVAAVVLGRTLFQFPARCPGPTCRSGAGRGASRRRCGSSSEHIRTRSPISCGVAMAVQVAPGRDAR